MRVKASGPTPADILLVGEAPGEVEVRWGRPFVGPSGDELDRLLDHAGYGRHQVRLTNVLDFRPPNNRDPLPAEVEAARPRLKAELARTRPKVVIPIGRFATHEFLPPYPMEHCQGLVFDHPDGFRVFPVFHPAYALRKPSIFTPLYEAFARLTDVVHGRIPCWREASPVAYVGSRTRGAIKACLESDEIAVDTEGSPEDPWGATWSSVEGQGVAVSASNARGLARLQAYINKARNIYLHECLGDLDVLEALGILVPPEKVVDTLILAFLLGTTAGVEKDGETRADRKALSLKLLGFRLAGMRMRTFKEVFEPLDAMAVRTWIEQMECTDGKQEKALARAYLSDTPRAALSRSKFTKDLQAPPKHIPWCDEMVQYAGADADATRRIGPGLQQMIKEAGLATIAQVDHGAIPFIRLMQKRRLLLDLTVLRQVRTEMFEEEQGIEAKIGAQAWEGFNPRASEQVEHLLYDWLDLPVVKWTKKARRRSTDEKALAQLDHAHAVIDDLVALRELRKLRSAYVEPLIGG